MQQIPVSQLTLSLEPSLAERWPTFREYLAHRMQVQAKPAKTIAADMDLSPSILSRKLHPADGDTQRFNLEDLERYLAATGDAPAIIEYIAAKYMAGGDKARDARLRARAESLLSELAGVVAGLKAVA